MKNSQKAALLEECFRLATAAESNTWAFRRKMEGLTPSRRAPFITALTDALGDSRLKVENRRRFESVLVILCAIEQDILNRKDEASLREMAEQAARLDRQKLSEIARRHPRGRLVGGTQPTEYKAPGNNNTVWATKKKRRP